MSLFKCKVCTEKEKRIKELLEQVEYLRSLALPTNDPLKQSIIIKEADSILGGDGSELKSYSPNSDADKERIDDLEKTELQRIVEERDKILTGTY